MGWWEDRGFDDPPHATAPTTGSAPGPSGASDLPPWLSQPDPSQDPRTQQIKQQIQQILQHYGHPPLEGDQWLNDIVSGRTTIQNFEKEVRTTMGQPGAVKYDYAHQGASADVKQLWDSSGHDPQQFVQAYIKSKNLIGHQTDPAALTDIAGALKSVGVDASLDQRQDQYHKGLMINGSFVKMLDGSDNWIWGAGGDGGGGKETAPDLPRWTDTFSYAPWDKTFQAPTSVTEANDPGYQARLEEGTTALSHAYGAQGTFLTGGTAKAIDKFGQDYGSNEYDKVYGRAADTYQRQYQDYLGGYGRALGEYGQRENEWLTHYSQALGENDLAYSRGQNELGNEWNRYYQMANLGLNAATGTNAAGANFAGNASNLTTGAGNAQAAGQVGAGNAWNSVFGNLANLGMFASIYGRQPPVNPYGGYGNPSFYYPGGY